MHVPSLFISHSWSNPSSYTRLCDIINTALSNRWTNVSIARDMAIGIEAEEYEQHQRRSIVLSDLERIEQQLRDQRSLLVGLRAKYALTRHEAAELNDYMRREALRAELYEQILDPNYVAKITNLEKLEKKYGARDVSIDSVRLDRSKKELADAVYKAEGRLQELEEEKWRQKRLLANLRNILEPLVTHKGHVDGLTERYGTLALAIRSRIRQSDMVIVIAEDDTAYRQWLEFEYKLAFALRISTLAVVNDDEQLSPDLRRYGISAVSWLAAGDAIRRGLYHGHQIE